jgi:hypothetical protein
MQIEAAPEHSASRSARRAKALATDPTSLVALTRS